MDYPKDYVGMSALSIQGHISVDPARLPVDEDTKMICTARVFSQFQIHFLLINM